MKQTRRISPLIILFLVTISSVVAFAGSYIVKQRRNPETAETSTVVHKTEAEWQEESLPELYFDGNQYRYDRNILSYVFIGTDDSGSEFARGTDYRGRMADFLMLAVIDKTDKSYGFLQINRDTMTEVRRINNDGRELEPQVQQICTAHWYGTDPASSSVNTVQAVSDLLGELSVDGYYTLHMSDVGKLNSMVGGVKITIDEDLSKVDPAMTKGTTLVLDDVQAQRYVRARMDVGDGENTSRMRRQHIYLNAFMNQALAKIQEDPNFINDMFKTFEDVAVTDMTGSDISVITEQVRKGRNKGILQIKGKLSVGQALGDGVDHTEFYPKESSIIKQMKKLYSLKKVESDEDEDNEAYADEE